MTVNLQMWMAMPIALTVLAFMASAYSALSDAYSMRDDYIAIWSIWLVLMVVSMLSIWTSS